MKEDDYVAESMAKRSNRTDEYYNIISFDSARYSNQIVSIVFAAEIERCTHRPIMHMFDSVVCKNSSALVGCLLVAPKK